MAPGDLSGPASQQGQANARPRRTCRPMLNPSVDRSRLPSTIDDHPHTMCEKSTRRANQSSGQKPVQPSFKKYFAFAVGQINRTSSPRPFPARGALAIVTNAGWDAVDAAALARMVIAGRAKLVSDKRRAGRTTLFAYGKTVWSWHPLLVSTPRRRSRPTGQNLRRQFAGDGDKTNSSPGRARHKP
jgi:hypothetical protein